MSGFELIVLGVGDTFSDRYVSTSLLLSAEGRWLAVDAPDRYRAVLRQASERGAGQLDLNAIDDFLITHVHGDHMNGLEGVAFYKRFAQSQRLRLYASPEVRAVIWEQRLAGSMATLWNGHELTRLGFDDYFEFSPLPWGKVCEIGPFSVTTRQTRHHVPTSALLLRAAGRTLGYSADTAFDPELIEFLSCADLIVHETNLGPSHTALAALAELPAALRARMRLIHYPDSLELAELPIRPLHEGERLNV